MISKRTITVDGDVSVNTFPLDPVKGFGLAIRSAVVAAAIDGINQSGHVCLRAAGDEQAWEVWS